ncbi:MAG TPA: branched-chain amino acid ABC transporter permease [Syntrophales bacterium]|nr:branched-chain amino acid ABC transporter permease [Syntrophales bacterium]HOL58639.1 branched-chain amino acid ABC transporter permease [Syntrophales bacterium]HPO35073.1 branched-chain amino acid ABC transporter permease [Syntrophales bacterium]
MKAIKSIITNKYFLGLVLILLICLVPVFITSKYLMHIFILMLIWSIAALALNLIMGYTGQANLAHGGFFGIGAYATALLMLKLGFGFWPALIIAAIITSIIGFLIGLPTLRTKGSYFAIGTLCFNVIVFIAAERWESLTGGARGVIGIPQPAPISFLGVTFTFSSLAGMFYLCFFLFLITLIIKYRIVHSLVGRSLIAVRENEDLTSSIGLDTMRTKIISFVTSVFLASLAGSLYAVYIGFLDPEIASHHVTFEVLLFVVLGGIGTISGPIVGTIIVTLLGEILHFLDAYRLVAYGLVLVLVIIFMPQGIVGGIRALRQRMGERNS